MSKNSKLVEVVFKGERRAIYRNRNELDINEGDAVVVEAERGEDLGPGFARRRACQAQARKGRRQGHRAQSREKDLAQHNANLARKTTPTRCAGKR